MTDGLDWVGYRERVREHGNATLAVYCSGECPGAHGVDCEAAYTLGEVWHDVHVSYVREALPGRPLRKVSLKSAARMSLPREET